MANHTELRDDTNNRFPYTQKKKHNTMNMKQYILPLSIVLAGFLLGGGILGAAFILKDDSAQQMPTDSGPQTASISFEPVTESDHIRGSLEAPVKLIDYSDLECPFCKRHHETLLNLVESYETNEFAWVYRHFPLEQLHQKAIPEAVASECVARQAGEEAFWRFIDTIFEVTPSNDGLDLAQLPEYAQEAGVANVGAFQTCYDNEETLAKVEAELADASNAGGAGTPYSLITSEAPITDAAHNDIYSIMQELGAEELVIYSESNDAIGISGAIPEEVLTAIIDRILELN